VPPSTPTATYSGKTLGRCRIGKPIGKGANATVFRALYEPLKKEVAVKVLRPDAAASEEARARFLEEARALAKLDHPHVVRVYDVVEDGGFQLLIMDLVPGRSLAEVLHDDGPLDPFEACDAARQMALALEHVHGQRILHRDVKPGNIIGNDAGGFVLVDFGNAEGLGAAAKGRKGTAHYVAPEVFQGKKQDERTDTYSLGATLFHLLTGEPPYDGQSVEEILQAHEAGKLRKPSQVSPDAGIPSSLDDVVKRAMAPARGYRYLAKDLAAALDAIGKDLLAGGAKVAGKGGRKRKRAARSGGSGGSGTGGSGGALVAVGAVGLLVVGGLVFAATRKKDAPPPEEAAPPAEAPTPVDTAPPKPFDPGFDKRAEGRDARAKAARDAFAAAEAFEQKALGKPLEAAAKWAEVAKEYGEYSEGRQAAEREAALRDRAASAEEREARRLLAEQEAAARDAALASIDADIRAMRFAEAAGRMDELPPPGPEGRAAWDRRRKRLDAILGLRDYLNEGLQGSPVAVGRVRSGLGRSGKDEIKEATEEGLVVEGESGSKVVPWKEVQALDVVTLSREVLRKAAEPRLALAAFCFEMGMKREAGVEVDTALLTDRTGAASGWVKEMFGEELAR
jgi:tRNA A-37 threonylcarbamoyl transferase component Bud32